MKLEQGGTRGFTIVELLVVIVVIAILAAVTIVSYTGIQQRAREARVSTQLSQLRQEMELYRVDHNNEWPFEGRIRDCLSGAITGPQNCGNAYVALHDEDELVKHVLNDYIFSNGADIGSTNTGFSSYSFQGGLSETNNIQFCYGLAATQGAANTWFYISSAHPGVSPKGSTTSWCNL